MWPLIVVGAPAGVPIGKPSPGSISKTAAISRPIPWVTSRIGPQVPPFCPRRARRRPAAATSMSRPQTTKLVVWIQPRSPMASMLTGWRVRS
jgi:hypothetical protein